MRSLAEAALVPICSVSHRRLAIEGERAISAGGVVEPGSLDGQLASVLASVGGCLRIGKTVLLQYRRIRGVSLGGFALICGLARLGPAGKRLGQ